MKKLFALLILSTSVLRGLACDCLREANQVPFCKTISENLASSLVVKAKVKEQYYFGIRAEIIETIYGKSSSKLITIWGDNGALCRIPTTIFSIDDTVVFNLLPTDYSGNTNNPGTFPSNLEKNGDYILSSCGIYFLRVSNSSVSGFAFDSISPTTISYSLFIDELKSCFQQSCTEKSIIYPNPSGGMIYLATGCLEISTIKIYNLMGQLILAKEYDRNASQNEINVSSFSSGLYLISFIDEKDNISRTTKLIIDKK